MYIDHTWARGLHHVWHACAPAQLLCVQLDIYIDHNYIWNHHLLRAYEFLLKFYEFPESHIYHNCIEFLHASPFCAASATCTIWHGNHKCHSHILLPHVYTEHVLLNFLCILLCNHIFHNYILYVHALIECDYLKRFSRYICNHIWYICVWILHGWFSYGSL